jgi:CheY-like chemotaxis protein
MARQSDACGIETTAAGRRGEDGLPPTSLAPIVVLHVDDDPNDAELFRVAARKAEAHFVLNNAEDAEKAIAYLSGRGLYADRRNFPLPSLVLLDLKMPRVTGLEVLQWIRCRPEWAQLPVVVLSGSELQDDIQRAYEMGANSYLIKPLGFEALVGLVKSIQGVWLANPGS